MDLDILALSKLLQDPDSQNDETEKSPQHGLTPASFGSAAAYRPQSYKRNKNDDECVPTSYDDRKEPPYQLYYKQLVGTEDVFFGTEKSPASSDSTHIVVKVYFPGRSMEDLKLDVTSNRLDVESPDRYIIFHELLGWI